MVRNGMAVDRSSDRSGDSDDPSSARQRRPPGRTGAADRDYVEPGSALIDLPEDVAELRHFRVGADRDAEHVVERREGTAGCDAEARHGVDELAGVAAAIDHHKVGVRLYELQAAVAQPRAHLAAGLGEDGAALPHDVLRSEEHTSELQSQ